MTDGTVSGGHPDPGAGVLAVRPERRHARPSIQGLDSVPADTRPTLRQVNVVHLAWDVMVGLGTLLFLLSAWYGAELDLPTPDARQQVVPAGRGVPRACSR